MKKTLFSGAICALAVTACVNRGPDRLEACFQDSAFFGPYMASTDFNRVLVGGIGPAGEVRCYWSEDDKVLSITTTSSAWKICKRDSANCTILASGSTALLNDRMRSLGPQAAISSGPSRTDQVIWYLMGQFAQGFAVGLGAGVGANLISPRAPVAMATPPTPAPRAPSPAPPVLTPTARPGFGEASHGYTCTPMAGQAGSYVCR